MRPPLGGRSPQHMSCRMNTINQSCLPACLLACQLVSVPRLLCLAASLAVTAGRAFGKYEGESDQKRKVAASTASKSKERAPVELFRHGRAFRGRLALNVCCC